MKTTTKKTKTLPTDADGYVRYLRCKKEHSGNTRYVQDGAYCQCTGCGHFLTVEYAQLHLATGTGTPGTGDTVVRLAERKSRKLGC